VDLDVVGIPQLIPLPRGGLLFTVWNHAFGLLSDGSTLWHNDTFNRPLDWVSVGDQLLLSTAGSDGSLWLIDETETRLWRDLEGGGLSADANNVFLFNDQGLLKLNPAERTSIMLNDWPRGGLRASDVLALDDGGALASYFSRSDRRLVRYDASGELIWQRSVPDEIPGAPTILAVDGELYLAASSESNNTGEMSIYAVDIESARLTHLFAGGTRTPVTRLNSIHRLDDSKLLLNLGGGHLVSLDLATATKDLASSSDSLPQ
jgi:outer membrane protein assembly factor BamB